MNNQKQLWCIQSTHCKEMISILALLSTMKSICYVKSCKILCYFFFFFWQGQFCFIFLSSLSIFNNNMTKTHSLDFKSLCHLLFFVLFRVFLLSFFKYYYYLCVIFAVLSRTWMRGKTFAKHQCLLCSVYKHFPIKQFLFSLFISIIIILNIYVIYCHVSLKWKGNV